MAETGRNDDRSERSNNAKNQKGNRIQVSNTKKPLSFYLELSKRYLRMHDSIELSALGMAIPTVVIIAEILKRTGLAAEKRISISTVTSRDETRGRTIQKARLEVELIKLKSRNGKGRQGNT